MPVIADKITAVELPIVPSTNTAVRKVTVDRHSITSVETTENESQSIVVMVNGLKYLVAIPYSNMKAIAYGTDTVVSYLTTQFPTSYEPGPGSSAV